MGEIVHEETFLSMCQLKRENGVWWIGSGKNRRRDDEEVAPAENEEVNEEEAEAQLDFDWEAVVDETAFQGESGSDDQFYDAQVEVEEMLIEKSHQGRKGSRKRNEKDRNGYTPGKCDF
ncbi:hypothetical protein Dimus_022369, partial [Dionaea muscipula]